MGEVGFVAGSLAPITTNFIGKDHDTLCAVVLVLQSGTARVGPAVAWPLAAPLVGSTCAVQDCSSNRDSADRLNGQFIFYNDHHVKQDRRWNADKPSAALDPYILT